MTESSEVPGDAAVGRRPLLDAWRRLVGQLQRRADSEHEQILIRVGFAILILAYLLLATPAGSVPAAVERLCLLISAGYLAGALALLGHVLARPEVRPRRRYAGMLLDLVTLPTGMIVGGALVAPLYPMFLWITFGMGFRYGARYLFAAAGLSVAGFAVVIAATPYWRSQPTLAFSLLVALIVLPAYVSTLLGKLTEAVRRAEEASRAKSRFLATMSHELRTPLNAIIGMTDLLRGTRLDADQGDMVTTTQSSAQALLGLIDDVLDFSKIESGRIDIERVPFDLHALIVAVDGMLRHQAAAKGLWLRTTISARAPYRLHGGAQALRQVLINLIANAIKFTERGGVTVRVGGAPTGASGARLRVEVIDTGIGIPEGAQARIFESFTQVDESTTRRFGGTGLGLAIARELITAMGGRLGVTSAPGRGSTFWFELPLERLPHGTDDDGEGGSERRRLDGRAVILGGGEAVFVRYGRRLAAWGLDVVPAADLTAAVAALAGAAAGGRPAVTVVVDDGDDDLSGGHRRRLAADLTARSPGGRRPAMVLVGAAAAAALDGAADLVAVVRPPAADDAELFAALHAALARPEVRPQAPARAVRGPRSRNRRILVAEDNRVNQRVIAAVLERAGHSVRLVANGEEALDALDEERFDLVLLDLHMPEMGGLEAAKLYRFTHLDRPRPPLVALTADATAEARRQCADAGIEQVVTKPIEGPRLLELIDRLTGGAAAVPPHPPAAVAAVALPPGGPSFPPPAAEAMGATVVPFSAHATVSGGARPALDRSRLDMLRALDDTGGFMAEIVGEFLTDAGQLADELATAAAEGDARSFRDLAHALSSSAAHVGAVVVIELCAGWRGIGPDELAERGTYHIARLRKELERTRSALLAECGGGGAPGRSA